MAARDAQSIECHSQTHRIPFAEVATWVKNKQEHAEFRERNPCEHAPGTSAKAHKLELGSNAGDWPWFVDRYELCAVACESTQEAARNQAAGLRQANTSRERFRTNERRPAQQHCAGKHAMQRHHCPNAPCEHKDQTEGKP